MLGKKKIERLHLFVGNKMLLKILDPILCVGCMGMKRFWLVARRAIIFYA